MPRKADPSIIYFPSHAAADAHLVLEEINSLQRRLRLTSAQKARLATLQQQLDAFNSPVNSLPDELFSHIFQLGFVDNPCPLAFSILVSHVTLRWRRIALRTPFIWSHVRLDFPHILQRGVGDGWQTILERSGACPLILQVTYDAFLTTSYRHDRQASELLRSLYHRTEDLLLRTVGMVAGPSDPDWGVLRDMPLSSLKTLSLFFMGLASLEYLLGVLSGCKKLEMLQLHDIALMDDPDNVPRELITELPFLRTYRQVETTGQGTWCDILSHIEARPKRMSLVANLSRVTSRPPLRPGVFAEVEILSLQSSVPGYPCSSCFFTLCPFLSSLTQVDLIDGDFGPPTMEVCPPFKSSLSLNINFCTDLRGIEPLVDAIQASGTSHPPVMINIKRNCHHIHGDVGPFFKDVLASRRPGLEFVMDPVGGVATLVIR